MARCTKLMPLWILIGPYLDLRSPHSQWKRIVLPPKAHQFTWCLVELTIGPIRDNGTDWIIDQRGARDLAAFRPTEKEETNWKQTDRDGWFGFAWFSISLFLSVLMMLVCSLQMWTIDWRICQFNAPYIWKSIVDSNRNVLIDKESRLNYNRVL